MNQKIQEFREQGYSFSEIAKKLKISKTTAHRLAYKTSRKTPFRTFPVVPNRSTRNENGTILERKMECFLQDPKFMPYISDLDMFKGYNLFLVKEAKQLVNTINELFDEFHQADLHRKNEINIKLEQLCTTFETKRLELVCIINEMETESKEQHKETQNPLNQILIKIQQNETLKQNERSTQERIKTDFHTIVQTLKSYNLKTKSKKALKKLINQIDEFEKLSTLNNTLNDELNEILNIKKNICELIQEDKDNKSEYLDLDLDDLEELADNVY